MNNESIQKGNGELSNPDALRQALEAHRNEQDITFRELSRKMRGVGISTISEWLRGIYKGDNERVEDAVRTYLLSLTQTDLPLENDLRTQLRELMNQRELTGKAVARSLGINGSVLSQWFSISYKGDVSKLDRAVVAYLRRAQNEASQDRTELPHLQTIVSRQLEEIARMCDIRQEMGVAVGSSGIGKTQAIAAYRVENPSTVLVEVVPTFTTKVLLDTICSLLSLSHGTLHQMFERLVDKLRDTQRLLIIDEAEHLPVRALEMLRRLHDQTRIGVLLVGMPRLRQNIEDNRRDFSQIANRIGYYMPLTDLRASDIELFASEFFDEGCPPELLDVYGKCAQGCARRLVKLLSRSVEIARRDGTPVTEDIVTSTADMLSMR